MSHKNQTGSELPSLCSLAFPANFSVEYAKCINSYGMSDVIRYKEIYKMKLLPQ